jgi:hypothetical protein
MIECNGTLPEGEELKRQWRRVLRVLAGTGVIVVAG